MPSIHPLASRSEVQRIIHILQNIYALSEKLEREIYENMYSMHLKKDEVLIEEGDISMNMYFILKGALMAHSNYEGKKITTYISVENEFVSSISGMHGMSPTKEGIIAVEPTEMIYISNETINYFFETYFEFNYAFRVLVQKYYQDAQERSHIIRVGDAKQRYFYFLQTKPGYIDRLPVEHIASLLDMKPQTLQRIRKQHALLLQKDTETENLYRLLEKHMGEKEAYKDKHLNLSVFSKMLNITPHRLSSLLNNIYNQNFVDFVNSYRIRNIQKQMADPESMQNLTIEALAYKAGFSSRSAFYNAFKKQVEMSPKEYAQSLKCK